MTHQKQALITEIESIFEENTKKLLTAREQESKYIETQANLFKKVLTTCLQKRNLDTFSTTLLEYFHTKISKLAQNVDSLLIAEEYGNVDDKFSYELSPEEELDGILDYALGVLTIVPSNYSESIGEDITTNNFDVLLCDEDTLHHLDNVAGDNNTRILIRTDDINAKVAGDHNRVHLTSLSLLDEFFVVPDKLNGRVKLFSQSGELKHKYDKTNIGFQLAPSYVAVDEFNKTIYVTDDNTKTIVAIDANGALKTTFRCAKPRGIAFFGDLLYITDDSYVNIVDPSSQSQVASLKGYFHKLSYIAVSNQGHIAVSHYNANYHKSVMLFDKDKNLISEISNVVHPYGLCFSVDNKLCIADYGGGDIKMYDIPPTESKDLVPKSLGLEYPTDICFSPRGSTVVTEYMSGHIKSFDVLS